jgi:hypothetical protein
MDLLGRSKKERINYKAEEKAGKDQKYSVGSQGKARKKFYLDDKESILRVKINSFLLTLSYLCTKSRRPYCVKGF